MQGGRVSVRRTLGTTLIRATLAALVLLPAVGWAQQPPVHQKRNSQNQQNGVSTNISIVPNALSSPLLRNPEGLTPVLSLGPLPRNNASPQFISDSAYMNTQINQQIIPLTNQYLNMQQNMAGGQGPAGSTQSGNGSSVKGSGVGANGKVQGKNSRGLTPQKQSQQNGQGSGAHSNPAQGQGQSP
jgi:hypothetical protein